MANHGQFSGNPKTEWLTSLRGEDREMALLEDFSFVDQSGKVWLAPKGSRIDGASIPRALWVAVGSPYTDDYRRASVVHDIACDTPGVPRKAADEMFFEACLAGGCSLGQARILYAGVRIGAWSTLNLPASTQDRGRILFRQRLDVPTVEEDFLRGKLAQIAAGMNALPTGASIRDMDAVIEQHLKF